MQNTKKKSFLVAVVCLILCVALLVGTTFAWFSDSVSNTGNRIQAGTLDIDLLMDKELSTSAETDYVSIGGGSGDIFKEAAVAQNSNETLWEPGKTQAVFLAVENKGNLAVKYTAYIDVTDGGLVGSLEYALFDEGTYVKYKELIDSGKDTWAELKALATVSGDVREGRTAITTGVLDEIAKGTTGERDYVALAVHMKEDADNENQGENAVIDVTIAATQMTAEEDGFGNNQYDRAAGGVVLPTAIEGLVYDGTDQALINSGITESGTFKYAVSDIEPEDDAYSEGIPTGKNAGTYTVWYKIYDNSVDENAGAESLSVTISRASSKIVIAPEPRTLEATGDPQQLVTGGSAEGGTLYYALGQNEETVPETGWSTDIPTGTVGTYYVWYKVRGDENHTDTDPECVVATISACFAAGTEITMADGSLKNIENVAVGDNVLTFNHETGRYEAQSVYIAYAGQRKAKAFTLHFDNGNTVSIVGEHDLFEKESLKYVTIDYETAEQFTGRHFYSVADGRYVELVAVTYETEPADYYSLYIEYNTNCIANGMLSCSADCDEMLNMYTFYEDLSIDQVQLEADIAEYGLYEYPSDADYAEELHDAYRWDYMYILIGKGFGTQEYYFSRRDAVLAGDY